MVDHIIRADQKTIKDQGTDSPERHDLCSCVCVLLWQSHLFFCSCISPVSVFLPHSAFPDFHLHTSQGGEKLHAALRILPLTPTLTQLPWPLQMGFIEGLSAFPNTHTLPCAVFLRHTLHEQSSLLSLRSTNNLSGTHSPPAPSRIHAVMSAAWISDRYFCSPQIWLNKTPPAFYISHIGKGK